MAKQKRKRSTAKVAAQKQRTTANTLRRRKKHAARHPNEKTSLKQVKRYKDCMP
jgi:hypothetical protein